MAEIIKDFDVITLDAKKVIKSFQAEDIQKAREFACKYAVPSGVRLINRTINYDCGVIKKCYRKGVCRWVSITNFGKCTNIFKTGKEPKGLDYAELPE